MLCAIHQKVQIYHSFITILALNIFSLLLKLGQAQGITFWTEKCLLSLLLFYVLLKNLFLRLLHKHTHTQTHGESDLYVFIPSL